MSAALRVVLTSRPGPRKNPVTGKHHDHGGADLAVPVGTRVVAIWPGRVVSVLFDAVNGAAVVVDHRPAGIPYLSSYVHLSGIRTPKGWIDVTATEAERDTRRASLIGRVVQQGELLGLSGGAPGSWGAGRSTGPHLHLGLRDGDGEVIDPVPLIAWGQSPGIELWERHATTRRLEQIA